MRMEQWIGLSDRGQALINGKQILLYTEQVSRIYPDDTVTVEICNPRQVFTSSVQKEQYKMVEGAFGEQHVLLKYTFPSGMVYFEKIQSEPWSSGPCTFVALTDEKGNWVKESLWMDEEIQQLL